MTLSTAGPVHATVWGHLPGGSPLHRASARVKLIALLGFAVVVVATPRDWFIAFVFYGAFVSAMLGVARIPPSVVLRRMVIETPFIVFAVLMPFLATGPRLDVGAVALSIEGLWGAWSLLVKATLTLLASVVLVCTTEPRRIVLALESLRLPRQLTSIMAFMLRYADLIVAESSRMRTARQSRGFQSSGPRSWPVLARGVGALFARSHARGERVHLAMLSRGSSEAGAP